MKPGKRLDQEFADVYEHIRLLAERVTALEVPTPEQSMYLGAASGRQPWVHRIIAFKEFLARTPGIPPERTMHRSYTSDDIRSSLAAGFNVFGSIKPPLDITYDNLNYLVREFLPGDNQKLTLAAHHEPEVPSKGIDPHDWVALQERLQAVCDQLRAEGYDVEHATVLMAWTFEQGNEDPWLFPADIQAIDGYDKWGDLEAAEVFGSFLASVRETFGESQRWGVAEFGVHIPEHWHPTYSYNGVSQWENGPPQQGNDRTNPDARRWVRDALAWFREEGSEFALAFDSYVDGPWSWLYLAEEMK